MNATRRSATSSAQARQNAGLRFWVEFLLIGGTYGAYSVVRNLFGSASVEPEVAARNADRVIRLERALGTYIEPDVQGAFIDWTTFIQFWNVFYGTAHFVVTFGVLVWLYRSFPDRYRFWRRAGVLTTVMALVGFAAFPLMPPRLLGDCGPFGACRPDDTFVDTIADIGGLWSFESPAMESVSNQYAAMPSLHIGWALWCALVLVPRLSSRRAKAVAATYPLITLFAIVVTANHYWIDGLGGALIVGAGLWLSNAWDRVIERSPFSKRDARSASVSDGFTTREVRLSSRRSETLSTVNRRRSWRVQRTASVGPGATR